ncbi:hypothetical protein HK101_005191 [Irineochytrium annulatum]|nr:hypothetical protein HK101_005191 [Irineochytrium annulatum]
MSASTLLASLGPQLSATSELVVWELLASMVSPHRVAMDEYVAPADFCEIVSAFARVGDARGVTFMLSALRAEDAPSPFASPLTGAQRDLLTKEVDVGDPEVVRAFMRAFTAPLIKDRVSAWRFVMGMTGLQPALIAEAAFYTDEPLALMVTMAAEHGVEFAEDDIVEGKIARDVEVLGESKVDEASVAATRRIAREFIDELRRLI